MLFWNGEMNFCIPCNNLWDEKTPPNKHVHSIGGQCLYLIFWELIFPHIQIKCDCGNRKLVHDRTNFFKKKSLFPIFNLNGPPDWAIVMSYVCNSCGARMNGNDGCLLFNLPPYICDLYPMYPRYVSGTFHLNKMLLTCLKS